ncbi:hypothetical protein CDL12_09198 [Handroanthus impetiginosus]|uniref:Uncharacterized protein n=1 Tax=Handroanthus impetiginosus TaxID=429701 RepID=A0A2G9HKS5_9LAMI|nr:hypothetical protein CDL12_09198 [Handroanthus impetiginosus]
MAGLIVPSGSLSKGTSLGLTEKNDKGIPEKKSGGDMENGFHARKGSFNRKF